MRDYNKVLDHRDRFYAAIAEIGNEIDNRTTHRYRIDFFDMGQASAAGT